MKKIYATKSNTSLVPQPRSLRRLFKQMFAGIIKRQSGDVQNDIHAMVLKKLQDIEDSIEIMAREMARQAKRRE